MNLWCGAAIAAVDFTRDELASLQPEERRHT
jgi:hypothetical protein